MSNYQQAKADQQVQDVEIDAQPREKKSKSKGRKSKSKKKQKNNASQKQDDQIQIDKQSVPQRNAALNQQDHFNSTLTKPNANGRTNKKNVSNASGTNGNTVEKQVKLNFFMRKKTENSNVDSSSLLCSSRFAIPEYERKQASLQKQLIQKQALIQKLKTQKQINFQKYTKLKVQSQENRHRQKNVLQSQLRESSKLKREEKTQINPKMGYYKQANWTMFVEGDYILTAKRKVQKLQTQIKQLEEKRRNAKQEQRQRFLYQIDFLNKQKNQATITLKNRQNQLSSYKQRLRLADKESHCTLAKANWPLINERYLPLELLGSGGFGEVYKAYDLERNSYVALKTNCFQPTKNMETKHEFIKHAQRQIQTLKSLNHPNIAKLIDQIYFENKVSFVLEYCSGPQLSTYLIKRGHLDEKQGRGIIKQISFALKYMFEQKHRIIHYDLKPANIIFHNGCVKILDFGLCKRMQTQDTKIDLTSQGVGTYWYLPPQTFKDYAQISPKVDVWSLGVIFYELLYGMRPFGHGIKQSKIYHDGIILKAFKVEFPQDKKFKVSEEAKQFIRDCVKYSPQERLDPLEVYEHNYLKQ